MQVKSLLFSLSMAAAVFVSPANAGAVEVPAGAVVLVSEDFSKFASGSFGAPDEDNDLAWAGISEYTQMPGWDGSDLYPAGGCCYIGLNWFYMPGYLATPEFDGSANDGCYTIAFRACGTAADQLNVTRQGAENQSAKFDITTEWQDYSYDFTAGSAKDYFEIEPSGEALYIDDIVIYYVPGASQPAGTVLFEPFDSFAEGSEDNPVPFVTTDGVIDDSATNQPGWRGRGLFQCGGSAYLGNYGGESNPQSGYLQTPVMNLSGNGGKYTVSFKARVYDWGFGFGGINVSVFDANTGKQITNNYADITNEWTDCSIDFSDGSERCYLIFSSALGEAHIDDIAVIQEIGAVAAPMASGWSKLGADCFTANWAAVDEADSYLLSVYTLNSNKRVYILEDEAVDGLSHMVTGIDITKPCYYVVKAVGSAGVSAESNQVMVLGLPEPELFEATDVTSSGFTARWGLVDRATAYILNVHRTTTVAEAGSFDFINEDFSGFTGGSISNPMESSGMDFSLDSYLNRAGWTIHLLAWAEAALGIDNRYVADYGASWIHSHSLDLSGCDGKVNVSLRHHGQSVKKFTVSLCDAQGNVLSSKELTSVADWSDDVLTLDNGTSDCYLSIDVPSSQSGILFLDRLQVSREVAAGEVVTLPVAGYEVSKPNGADVTSVSKEVSLPSWGENEEYAYTVQARRTYFGQEYNGYIYSKPETYRAVARPQGSGIESSLAEGVSARCSADGYLTVEAPDDVLTAVYSVSGMTVASGEGSFGVALPGRGVYIVNVGGTSIKLVY